MKSQAYLNSTLLLHCSLLVLPMLLFTAVIIGLIYYYDWARHHPPVPGLDLRSGFYQNVFYVDLTATRLILVASWSSSAVLTLIGSFMTLMSFTIAADMLWSSERRLKYFLPSAPQLATLIDLLDGKRLALWQWITSIWSARGLRTRSIWMLEALAAIQIFALSLRYIQTGLAHMTVLANKIVLTAARSSGPTRGSMRLRTRQRYLSTRMPPHLPLTNLTGSRGV